MRANMLRVNTDKTNFVVFKSRHKIVNNNISLVLPKQQMKFLGVYLNENLYWKSHIDHVCKKISKSSGIIFRARLCLSSNAKLSLYYTFIYPYLTYCNIVWSSTYISHLTAYFCYKNELLEY